MIQRFLYLNIFLFVCNISSQAQQKFNITHKIDWKESYDVYSANILTEMLSFEDCLYNEKKRGIPIFSKRIKVDGPGTLKADFSSLLFEDSTFEYRNVDDLPTSLKLNVFIEQEKSDYYAVVSFYPILREGDRYKRVSEFEIGLQHTLVFNNQRDPNFATSSILQEGDIFKLAVNQTGIYKLDFNYLSNTLGINMSSLNPNNISIYGNGGSPVPEANADDRIDDLYENAILIEGEGDNSFDANDYILFYGEAAGVFSFDSNKVYDYRPNAFDDENYYYLVIGNQEGKRISNQNSTGNQNPLNEYYKTLRFEENKFNLLGAFSFESGSGRDTYGDEMSVQREIDLSSFFDFPNIVKDSPISISSSLASRSNKSSIYTVSVDNQTFNKSISSVNTSYSLGLFARIGKINEELTSSGDNPSVLVRYNQNTGSVQKGWLDYLQITAINELKFDGTGFEFYHLDAFNQEENQFNIQSSSSDEIIWDISNTLEPKNQEFSKSGNQLSFGFNSTNSDRFYVFNKNGNFLSPIGFENIPNQNLHGIDDADAIFIYHKDFKEAAERLAEHRKSQSDLVIYTVDVDNIFNEFSSGKREPAAIRDFARMLSLRKSSFNYLVLIGDGTYDYHHTSEEYDDHNFIPAYETRESLHPILAFPTDDFYGLLSEQEGISLRGAVDIAVGRIPVTTAQQANDIVDKIISYESDPDGFGEWRLRMTMAADDEDGNAHIIQADKITTKTDTSYELFNQEKIYFDAFPQVSTAGGDRYPEAEDILIRNFFRGMLILSYLGHGGPNGWAQERVLKVDDISNLSNKDKLPLLITATCSFTGYDDPSDESAGERMILQPNGGAIALFSTVRAVYSDQNARLTEAAYDIILNKKSDEQMTLGESMRLSKNANSADTIDTNARKFTLIGDPTMKLAIPKYNVVLNTLNDKNVALGEIDTLSSLEPVNLTGQVQNYNGELLENFNGKVYVTLFDKALGLTTLGNDQSSYEKSFNAQTSVIFKGTASVTNGKFDISFIVPKDIRFEYGKGKISFYATDGISEDAGGFYKDVIIGGNSVGNIEDDQGPLVEVFMNNEEFVIGGLTDEDPILLVKLTDDYGINIVGTSIGHDLKGVLDDDTGNSFIMNDFYEGAIDNFKQGEVRYPLFDIEPGLHTVKVTAWDIANNSSEGYTEFIVAEDADLALAHVLNYPNPFTTNTNFQFEHNFAGSELNVEISIYSMGGKLVKRIEKQGIAEGYRMTDISWNGKDQFGDQLAKGVYIYKVKVDAIGAGNSLSAESEFERLVILK